MIDLVADAPVDAPAPLQAPSTGVLVETLDLWTPCGGSARCGHDGLDPGPPDPGTGLDGAAQHDGGSP